MTGTVIAGRFALGREAGAGGMGTVYCAQDLTSGGTVALKLLSGAEPRGAERFAREATILAELVHPHIVRYIAHGTAPDGRRYLAMEWLDGQDLGRRAQERPFEVAETVEVLRRASDALAFAHARAIVHRDIKPENLFLPGSEVARLKLLDFGIAHLGSGAGRLTRTGALMGTPGYLAPEIIKGTRDVEPQVDVFALGCIGYFCLTGQSPFEADDVGAVLTKILLGEVPPLADVRPGVPPELSELVASMLSKDPASRPRDGGAVLARLAALPVLADAPNAPARARSVGITRSEQRIACLVFARVAAGVGEALPAQLAPLGVSLHVLPAGAIVLVPSAPRAADQASTAARAALAILARDPRAQVCVCTGSGQFSAGTPRGGIVEVGMSRLAVTREGEIAFDDMGAALLDRQFDLQRGPAGTFLRAHRSVAEPRRVLLGKRAPFVGRAREHGQLTGTFVTCATEGVGCAVVITGAPGSGKSRLGREFLDWVDGQSERAEVLVGTADPLSAGSPFALLGQALRRVAGIDDSDGGEERRQKLQDRMGRALPAGERARIVSFLGELASVPFSADNEPSLRAARTNPQLMSDGMRRAWEDWLSAECARQPVILLLEDLHLADAGTISFVDVALRHLKDASFMVVGLARPELDVAFPGLWAARVPQLLRLGPLSRKAVESLIRDSLGAEVAPAMMALLVQRADGNPFFLEELIRAAHAGRTDHLPDSVLGMVQARLDAEGPVAKRILRAASVFGDRFGRPGLRALLGDDLREDEELSCWLDRLIEREVVCRLPGNAAVETHADGESFAFGHALVREAAYAMLTPEDRVLGHRLAGHHLETVPFCDPMVVGEHFRRGNEPSCAARWYDRAAAQALGANQLAAAIERSGLGLDALAVADPAGAATSALGGTLRLTRAEAHLWRGEFGAAASCAGAATAVLAPGTVAWLRAMTQATIAAGKQGHLDEVEARIAETSMVMIDPEASSAFITCLGFASMFLIFGGRFPSADALLGALDDLVGDGAHIDPQALALVHQARSIRASTRSDLGACLASVEAAVEAFERAGDLRNACTARGNLGFVYTELGDLARAERVLRDALSAAERMELVDVLAIVLHNLGRVMGLTGAVVEAERIERQAVELLEKEGDPRLLGLARVYLAEILLAGGRAKEAEAEAGQAIALLEVAPTLQVRAVATLAQAFGASGKLEEAVDAAERAHRALTELGGVEEGESEIRLRHAECLLRAGKHVEAGVAIERARECLMVRAALITSVDWRRRFLDDVPANARTLELASAWAARTPDAPSPLA